MANELVAKYEFGLESYLKDVSGNGLHGSYFGDLILGVPGQTGLGVLFGYGAIPSYASIPHDPGFSIGPDGLSVVTKIAPRTMTFTGSPAPLCTGFPAANYVTFLNKHGNTSQPDPQVEWATRLYPISAVGGVGCTGRAGRLSAYAFPPAGGLGAGAYQQQPRTPGVYVDVRIVFEPTTFEAPRVRLWVDGGEVPASPAALYSAYGVAPVSGTKPVLVGGGQTDSVWQQARVAMCSLSFRRGTNPWLDI